MTLGSGADGLSGEDAAGGISYEDYLRIFLFFGNTDEVTMRTVDRVEENLASEHGLSVPPGGSVCHEDGASEYLADCGRHYLYVPAVLRILLKPGPRCRCPFIFLRTPHAVLPRVSYLYGKEN